MNKQLASPSELARETLKTLAARKVPPTPENYARIFSEISGSSDADLNGAEKVLRDIADRLTQSPKSSAIGAALRKVIKSEDWEQCLKEIEKILPKQDDEKISSWANLIRDLLHLLETTHKGLPITRKKAGVETVLTRFAGNPEILFEKLTGLMRSWSESQITTSTIEIDSAPPPGSGTASPTLSSTNGAEMLGKLAELLAQALESILSAQPELTLEVQTLARQVRDIKTHEQVTDLAKQLRHFWIKVDLRGGDKAKVYEGLVRLLRLLVENVGEMVEGEEWLQGQVTILRDIISNPIDRHSIADAERSLRDAIIKQSTLKHSLSDAKSTLKNLMTTFIDRLGEITESTSDYHHKIEAYSLKISKSDNITELSQLLDDIMQDTRTIQASAMRSHEELINSRKQVNEAQAKIRHLEQELAQVSEMVRADQLTGALNRRGLDDAFQREATRCERSKSSLCVALLDIDNFKRLNDSLGHHAGDKALVHLSTIIQETLRPSDTVARYGGEEFAILLPDVGLDEAVRTIERLQRELTKKYFLNNNERVLITFSAGVALRAPEESQEELIGRADKAMYQSKLAGKNRVMTS